MPSTPTRRLKRLAVALALAAPALAGAQSLQELYDAARAFDATYLAAKASAAAAEYKAAQSDALARPSVTATAAVTTAKADTPTTGARTTNTVSAGVTGRYALFNRSNDAVIGQARKNLISAQADLDAAEQDLIVRVAQAYFDVLAAQDTLATTRAKKAATAEQLASAKRNFEVGTSTITDTREAQARFDLDAANEIAAENDLRTKGIALDQLVGRTGVAPKPLLLPTALPATNPPSAEEWVTVADQAHPTVRKARMTLDVAVLETAKARAAEKPTVDAVASVGTADNRGGAILAASRGNTLTTSIGLQLSWSLYTGGSTQNRIQETLNLEEKSRQDLEAARRTVAQGTRSFFFTVQSGLAQVKALEAAESSSKLALEATQLGYKVGVRVNLDVLNSQSQLFSTQRDLAKARYDVLVNGLKLRQASGQLAPTDVDAVNRLLAR